MKNIFFRVLSVCAAVVTAMLCSAVPQAYADNERAGLSFTSEEQDYINSHGTVKVGYVTDRIPVSFENKDGEADGISRYIFDRVSQLSGLGFEYEALPVKDVTYDYLSEHDLDLVTSVEFNEANKKARGILISNPYLSSRKVIVAREDLKFRYDEHFTAAVATGSQTLKKVLAEMFPNFELKDYDSISDCFDAVNSGDADLMIQNQYVVEYWLAKPKYENLNVIPISGLDDQLCFSAVVSLDGKPGPSQEDGQILIDILDKTIAYIGEDETGNYIIQGVMENQYEYEFSDFVLRYRYAVTIFIISVIVITIMSVMLVRQRIRFAESRADAKAKGRFLSTMSHEIRTPLNGLIGLNHLMSQKLDDKAKVSEYLRQSSVTAQYLLSLVNDILDSSKLQEEKMELAMNPVDIGFVIETIGTIEQTAMLDKKLQYTVDADIKYPYVIGDEVRIQQVLLNLLDNARKFTPKGGIVRLSLKQEKQSDNKILTSVTVSDTGKGMSEEFQNKIFDVFSRELETVSKGNQGTGLGLYISRRLAKLMGGDLTCISRKGEGSSFTFTFAAEQAENSGKDILQPEEHKKGHPCILIAEDNELNGEIMLELLRSSGFKAEIAENGKKALKKFSDSAPGTYGVILMDLLMPEMDGFEAAKAIRELDREDAKTVRIFACTANSFTEERDKAFASGMNDFISKPVDIDELLAKLYAVPSDNSTL